LASFLTEKDFRWPKKGDSPFLGGIADPNSPTWVNLDWLSSRNIGDSLLAVAFKEAGDKIIKELSRKEDYRNPDVFFMPIAYLYRHNLELKMKEITKLGIRLKLVEKDKKLLLILRNHALHPLWNCVRRVIEQYWQHGSKDDLNAAGRIVQEFHKIDTTGQHFRYTEDQKGNKTLSQLPESVQLIHLRDIFEGILNFLEGCESGLIEEVRMRSEMTHEY
jgi:hypothetical protein